MFDLRTKWKRLNNITKNECNKNNFQMESNQISKNFNFFESSKINQHNLFDQLNIDLFQLQNNKLLLYQTYVHQILENFKFS